VPNKHLYNGGSEWQNDYSNLPDYYQTFYRNYDAVLGRFVGVDPMPESVADLTTYNYAGNNPIRFNDPLGDNVANPWASNSSSPFVNPGIHVGFTKSYTDANGNFDSNAYGDDLCAMQDKMNADSGNSDDGSSGGSGYGSGGGRGVTLTNKADIAAFFNAIWYGPGVRTSFYKNGSVVMEYNYAEINVNDPNDNRGEAGIMGFWNSNGVDGAMASRIKKDDDQGGDQCPTCLIPSSVGNNIFENYAGGNNPMSYNGKENYSISPVNYTDLNSMHHDLNYDAHGGQGALSVFFKPSLMPYDYALINSSFDVAFDTNGRITLKDKLESLAVGVFFLIATAPKSVVYGL
jgi:RHS repeat-associated protein